MYVSVVNIRSGEYLGVVNVVFWTGGSSANFLACEIVEPIREKDDMRAFREGHSGKKWVPGVSLDF